MKYEVAATVGTDVTVMKNFAVVTVKTVVTVVTVVPVMTDFVKKKKSNICQKRRMTVYSVYGFSLILMPVVITVLFEFV